MATADVEDVADSRHPPGAPGAESGKAVCGERAAFSPGGIPGPGALGRDYGGGSAALARNSGPADQELSGHARGSLMRFTRGVIVGKLGATGFLPRGNTRPASRSSIVLTGRLEDRGTGGVPATKQLGISTGESTRVVGVTAVSRPLPHGAAK